METIEETPQINNEVKCECSYNPRKRRIGWANPYLGDPKDFEPNGFGGLRLKLSAIMDPNYDLD